MYDNIFNSIISKRIKFLRNERKLTLEQLAYQSEISKGGLSEIERGMKAPSTLTLLKLCCTLNISMKDFWDFPEINDFMNTFE